MEAQTMVKPDYHQELPNQALVGQEMAPAAGYPMYPGDQYARPQPQFNPALYSQSTASPAPGLTFSSSSPSLSNCSSPSYHNQQNMHISTTMEPMSSAHSQTYPQTPADQPSQYYLESGQNMYYNVSQAAGPNAVAANASAPFLPAFNLMPNAAGAPMQPPMDPNGYPMNSAPHFAPPVPAYYGDKPYHGLDDQTVALHHGYNQLSNRFDDPTQLALARPYQRADGSPFAAAMGGDPSLASYYTRFPTAKRTRSTTTKNKRYICQICHSAFARPSTLSTHMNKHTGAKPHMCPHPGCGKRFSVLSNMRRHRRIHDRNQAQSQMAAAAAAAAAAAVAGPSPLPSTLPATIIQQPKLEQVL